MSRRTSLQQVGSALERTSLLLLAGAISLTAMTLLVVPLPVGGTPRAATVLAIIAICSLAFAAVTRRVFTRHARSQASALTDLTRRLTEAEHMASVGRVAAAIAHEVGNPLTGISSFAHILHARARNSPDADVAFAGLQREVERVDRIVRELLDYARPRPDMAASFDATASLRHAVRLLADQGVLRRVAVQEAIAREPLALVGNPHQFEQAFINILLNAIDAMNAQGTLTLYAARAVPDAALLAARRASDDAARSHERHVQPRVAEWRRGRAADTQCLKIVIADSGSGVNAVDAERIFDAFYSTKSQNGGSGLGLAIVQRVVNDHGGVVWVQRAREGGAAFHVLLPLDLGAARRESSEQLALAIPSMA